MTDRSHGQGRSVAARDFSGVRRLVDVGGGHGALLAAILPRRHRGGPGAARRGRGGERPPGGSGPLGRLLPWSGDDRSIGRPSRRGRSWSRMPSGRGPCHGAAGALGSGGGVLFA
ncbi:methyltransferase [Sorangium sp. So ce1389]|uniref:methyltransferase n=1 Tax=Sorangium sp. So ce1389 TaxID=3133336 RepID=UPI003F613D6D